MLRDAEGQSAAAASLVKAMWKAVAKTWTND
jgi:hypothetical protein